jgi:hypothetical protein
MLEKENLKLVLLPTVLNNFKAYEVGYDERDGYLKLRMFITESHYLIISNESSGFYTIREYEVIKSHYLPSPRCLYINKYFKKFRDGYNYRAAHVPFDDLKNQLSKIKINLASPVERKGYYSKIIRAGGLY